MVGRRLVFSHGYLHWLSARHVEFSQPTLLFCFDGWQIAKRQRGRRPFAPDLGCADKRRRNAGFGYNCNEPFYFDTRLFASSLDSEFRLALLIHVLVLTTAYAG